MNSIPDIFSGILVPALTPFRPDLTPDSHKFAAFCKGLLDDGAHGLAVFGTTSEGNSLSVTERNDLLDEIVEAGVPAGKLLPGTGACAIADAVEMTRHAVNIGAGGVLVLPPFYYKNQGNDGFFAYFDQIIQRIGDQRLRLYLYHFPQMSAAPISHGLIERLRKAYPDTVVGLKDSSGDWEATRAIMRAFPDLAVFPSSESRIREGMDLGIAGCISATANMQAGTIASLIAAHGTPEADRLHEAVAALRSVFEKYPLVAALKAAMAHRLGDDGWTILRPPLTGLSEEDRAKLLAALDRLEPEAAV